MTFSKESGQKVWFTFYAFSIYSILPFFFQKNFFVLQILPLISSL